MERSVLPAGSQCCCHGMPWLRLSSEGISPLFPSWCKTSWEARALHDSWLKPGTSVTFFWGAGLARAVHGLRVLRTRFRDGGSKVRKDVQYGLGGPEGRLARRGRAD